MASTVYTEKLGIMRRVASLAAISRETGIPRSILTGISVGGGQLSGAYLKSFNTLYGKLSYQYLRDVGIPTSIASRFRGGSAGTVLRVYEEFADRLEYYTTGALLKHVAGIEARGITIDVSRLWDEMRERVREGMSRSKMDYADLIVKDRY